MKLVISWAIVETFKRELRKGGTREIGGVLVGEHLEAETFRLTEISAQHSGGTQSHFVRDVKQNKAFLEDFFSRTGNDYQRFNYLGEWHSHPLFAPTPSKEDIRTMWDIVRDPRVGANFAILLIVRLERSNVQMSATLFVPNYPQAKLTVELQPAPPSLSWWVTLRKLFSS